jgi:hypothetical protein
MEDEVLFCTMGGQNIFLNIKRYYRSKCIGDYFNFSWYLVGKIIEEIKELYI